MVANWLVTHAEEIGIQAVIWDNSIFSPSRSGQKLRAYTGPDPHVNHIRVELTHEAAAEQTPWFREPTPPPPPPEPATEYRVVSGDFDGNDITDVLTISPNAGGGWAQWAAIELSTGSKVTSTHWNATTPAHMRNGRPRARSPRRRELPSPLTFGRRRRRFTCETASSRNTHMRQTSQCRAHSALAAVLPG